MAWSNGDNLGLKKSYYQLTAHKAQDLLWHIRPASWIDWNLEWISSGDAMD